MTVILLGSEGELGSALVTEYAGQHSIIGVDRYKVSKQHSLQHYCQGDFSVKDDITRLIESLDLPDTSPLYVISTIGYFGVDYRDTTDVIDDFYQSILTNLTGIGHFCLSLLQQHDPAKLRAVLVGSAASKVGSRDIGYSTAKAGLNGLVVSLSKCFAEKGHSIIGICPGIFESPMSVSLSEDRQQEAINATHIKRKGQLPELVNICDYATFQAPDYLTGSLLSPSGGQLSF